MTPSLGPERRTEGGGQEGAHGAGLPGGRPTGRDQGCALYLQHGDNSQQDTVVTASHVRLVVEMRWFRHRRR
jgi:hypothetical protein